MLVEWLWKKAFFFFLRRRHHLNHQGLRAVDLRKETHNRTLLALHPRVLMGGGPGTVWGERWGASLIPTLTLLGLRGSITVNWCLELGSGLNWCQVMACVCLCYHVCLNICPVLERVCVCLCVWLGGAGGGLCLFQWSASMTLCTTVRSLSLAITTARHRRAEVSKCLSYDGSPSIPMHLLLVLYHPRPPKLNSLPSLKKLPKMLSWLCSLFWWGQKGRR